MKPEFDNEIIIDGEPVEMLRPRVVKSGGYIHTYNPRKMATWEKMARLSGMSQYKKKPIPAHVPLSVTLLVFRSAPKSLPKYKRKALGDDGSLVKVWPTKKPDIDNYGKSIIDSQNGVIWSDDNQIVRDDIWELYSKQPRVEVYWHEMPKTLQLRDVLHKSGIDHSDKYIYDRA